MSSMPGYVDLLVISDTHCGSIFGLWPPDYELTDGSRRGLTKGQQYLWKCWQHLSSLLAELQTSDRLNLGAVVLLGDLVDGRQSKQRGMEAVTVNTVDQARAFQASFDSFIAPFTPRPTIYAVWGTAYHDGDSGATMEGLAAALGATPYDGLGLGTYSKESLDLAVDGLGLNFAHGASSTTGLYRAVAIDREALWSAIAGKEGKVPKADLIARADVHYFIHVEHESKHAVINPCWELQTPFMRKKSQYRMLPDLGSVVIRVWKEAPLGGDRISVYKFIYPLPQRKPVAVALAKPVE